MKKELLPTWAQPYKKTGYDIRLEKGRYVLYKISSKRVKDLKYPKLIQEYIGVITEDGLKEKNSVTFNADKYKTLEFGLSNFIYKEYKRELIRSLFNSGNNTDDIVRLGIIYFVFGDVKKETLSSSFLTYKDADTLFSCYERISKTRVKTVVNKINKCLEFSFKNNKYDINLLIKYFNFQICLVDDANVIIVDIPSTLKEILTKYEVKYE